MGLEYSPQLIQIRKSNIVNILCRPTGWHNITQGIFMRLFIVGNGFDIDHGLKSKFVNFKEYLEQTYVPTFNREYVTFPNVGMGKDGEEVVDSNSASQGL